MPMMLELVDDAYRLTLIYRDVIQSSPDHLYLSALPFAPRSSALFQTYEQDAIDGVIILRPFEQEWTTLLRSLDLKACDMPVSGGLRGCTGRGRSRGVDL